MAEDIVALMRGARFPALRGRRPRPRRAGRLSARARPSRKGQQDRRARHRADGRRCGGGMDAARAMQVYHWMFLAQPAAAARNADRGRAAGLSRRDAGELDGGKSLDCFDADALPRYRAAFADPAAHPCDVRGLPRRGDARPRRRRGRLRGRPQDRAAAAGAVGRGRHPGQRRARRSTSGGLGEHVRGGAIEGGHFLPEEAPEATRQALAGDFLRLPLHEGRSPP